MINMLLSQKIYQELVNGRVINEVSYCSDGSLEPNDLYEELFRNYDTYYREHYESIGYELVPRNGFMFIRSLERNELYSEVAMKIQSLLMVLARGVQELGYEFALLTTHDAGVSDKLLEQIDTEEKRDILRACGLKGGLIDESRRVLEARNIAYRNAKGCLVLSVAGNGFFNEVFEQSS
ncbi:MAG: condensin complex protein MksE [Pontibacterium sp.]